MLYARHDEDDQGSSAMRGNIFVIGLADWQREELASIHHADEYRFVSLLSVEEATEQEFGFDELLERARDQLNRFDGRPDGIICHWDFPSSCIMPIIASEWGLPAPSLESVLKCEHKYWARLEQKKVVPDLTPGFQLIDPFEPGSADNLQLEFPIWIKPVKSYASQLGFKIKDRASLDKALEEMREKIETVGAPFNECLKRIELPDGISAKDGCKAVAETIISGKEYALEGYVLDNEVHFHGSFDLVFLQNGKEMSHIRYPSGAPAQVISNMEEAGRRILEQVGFNNGCFNIEFLWDEDEDQLWVVEVNTRMSQSHSDLLFKVNGVSNHEVAVSVVLGEKPKLEEQGGRFPLAAKCYLNKTDDAVVEHVPNTAEIESVSEALDGALIELEVEEGDRLSDLPNQPVYTHTVGYAWIGAQTEDELLRKHRRCSQELPLRFSDGKGLSAPGL